MKQRKTKVISLILIAVILLLNMTVISKAAGSFSASISKTTVTVGDTFTINVKASGAAGTYSVSTNNSKVSTSNSKTGFLDNSSDTLTFKATSAGTVTITAKATDMTDSDDDTKSVTGSKTFTVTIKEKSSNGGSGSSGGGSDTKTPTFTSTNKKVYTTGTANLRSSWSTSSSGTSVAKGTELTLTGTSTETINGYVWYRVSYKGATKYISSSLVTTTKPSEEEPNKNETTGNNEITDGEKSSNKNLSSLAIEGIELSPTFNKDVTQYTATVDGDVTELKINTKLEDSKSKVEIEGNKELKEGDNIIKVKVTAEDETIRTYFITVTKGEGIATDNGLKLSELGIKGVDFGDGFSPDTYRYELNLNAYVQKLNITTTANQADAKVEITGNSDFKEGKNIVTILLTSADGSQTATYQIEVNLPAELVAEANNPSMTIYIICGVVALVAIIIIILVIARYRTTSSKEDEGELEKDFIGRQYEEDDDKSLRNKRRESRDGEALANTEPVEDIQDEDGPTIQRKSDVTVDDFLDTSELEDKPKKSKGRHSV